MKIKNEARNSGRGVFGQMVLGVGIGYIITAIIFIMYAILLTYTDITDKNIQAVVMGTVIAATIAAGFDTSRYAEKRGLVWGMTAGLIYALIMIMIGVCAMPVIRLGGKTLMIVVLSASGGGLGGIIGINTKSKKTMQNLKK